MIEVFKTNVNAIADAHRLIDLFAKLLPSSLVTIDLEDCDKVLRIESFNCAFEQSYIIELLYSEGFNCEILT